MKFRNWYAHRIKPLAAGLWCWLRLLLLALVAISILGASVVPSGDELQRVRAFTRDLEFNYVSWTFAAFETKLDQLALGLAGQLTPEQRRAVVLDNLSLVARIGQLDGEVTAIYADPAVDDPAAASASQQQQIKALKALQEKVAPLAESILQDQVASVLAEMGLTLGGQPIPPVWYRSSSLPTALIVSPRDVIRQDANISLTADMPVDERAALEGQVDQALNVSSLVVDVGGIGVYPTMVMQTTDLNWLTEVISHEWTHNYLTLRPLGLSYLDSPELRTFNETVASISGKEIGRAVMERYYPDLVPSPPPETEPGAVDGTDTPVFDFREEMRITRLKVDELLAAGEVDEAEAYMEARRVFFWDHGYRHLRKLNQAYFAFYGAYADQPGGEAGEDPVGAAVRALRAQSPSLAAFLNRVAWMNSVEQLQRAVDAGAKGDASATDNAGATDDAGAS